MPEKFLRHIFWGLSSTFSSKIVDKRGAMCYNVCRGDKIENQKFDSDLNVCSIIGSRRIYKDTHAVLSDHTANPVHNSRWSSSRRSERSNKRWNICAFRAYGSSDFYRRRRNFLHSSPDVWFFDRLYHRRICYGKDMLHRQTNIQAASARKFGRLYPYISDRYTVRYCYNISVYKIRRRYFYGCIPMSASVDMGRVFMRIYGISRGKTYSSTL